MVPGSSDSPLTIELLLVTAPVDLGAAGPRLIMAPRAAFHTADSAILGPPLIEVLGLVLLQQLWSGSSGCLCGLPALQALVHRCIVGDRCDASRASCVEDWWRGGGARVATVRGSVDALRRINDPMCYNPVRPAIEPLGCLP